MPAYVRSVQTIWVDTADNVYLVELSKGVAHKIPIDSGYINLFAGLGYWDVMVITSKLPRPP